MSFRLEGAGDNTKIQQRRAVCTPGRGLLQSHIETKNNLLKNKIKFTTRVNVRTDQLE